MAIGFVNVINRAGFIRLKGIDVEFVILMSNSTCPKCGGPARCTARQDDICLNGDCGFKGFYYRCAFSDMDPKRLQEINEHNQSIQIYYEPSERELEEMERRQKEEDDYWS